MADPLVLPSASHMLEDLGHWDDDEWCQPKRPWRFELVPDELHEAKISGGTHDVLLPTINADPIIEGVSGRPEVTLVTYLRISLGFGGWVPVWSSCGSGLMPYRASWFNPARWVTAVDAC